MAALDMKTKKKRNQSPLLYIQLIRELSDQSRPIILNGTSIPNIVKENNTIIVSLYLQTTMYTAFMKTKLYKKN